MSEKYPREPGNCLGYLEIWDNLAEETAPALSPLRGTNPHPYIHGATLSTTGKKKQHQTLNQPFFFFF